MGHIVDSLMYKWETATITDYGHCVLAIVIIAWFVSKTSK